MSQGRKRDWAPEWVMTSRQEVPNPTNHLCHCCFSNVKSFWQHTDICLIDLLSQAVLILQIQRRELPCIKFHFTVIIDMKQKLRGKIGQSTVEMCKVESDYLSAVCSCHFATHKSQRTLVKDEIGILPVLLHVNTKHLLCETPQKIEKSYQGGRTREKNLSIKRTELFKQGPFLSFLAPKKVGYHFIYCQ